VRTSRRPAALFEGEAGVVWLLRPRPSGAAFATFEQRAASAMLDHGLSGWAFGFGRGKRTLGTTRVVAGATHGTVRVSRHLIAQGATATLEDTLLHEIAHAVAYQRHGRAAMNHGPLWRAVAREVGAQPRATCRGDLVLPAPYRLVCARCGAEVGLYRRPKHAADRYRHRGCGGRFRLASGD
jgi:predicted SprT family Zn-dependent metalloprotease